MTTNGLHLSTCRRIEKTLGKNRLIHRCSADDGLPPGEGAFGPCSFCSVECAARGGETEVARCRFDHLLSFSNDVGLLAEEIDADAGAALGNFPQAFTHVALVNAAIALYDTGGQGT